MTSAQIRPMKKQPIYIEIRRVDNGWVVKAQDADAITAEAIAVSKHDVIERVDAYLKVLG